MLKSLSNIGRRTKGKYRNNTPDRIFNLQPTLQEMKTLIFQIFTERIE